MDTTPGGGGRVWAPWTVVLPGTMAVTVAVALGTVGWWGVGFGVGSTCTDDFSCGSTSCVPCASFNAWWVAGGIGQWVLVVVAVVMLVLGLRRPGSRRSAAIATWSLIPLAIGWMVFWTVQAAHLF
jgi:hypothetical protein